MIKENNGPNRRILPYCLTSTRPSRCTSRPTPAPARTWCPIPTTPTTSARCGTRFRPWPRRAALTRLAATTRSRPDRRGLRPQLARRSGPGFRALRAIYRRLCARPARLATSAATPTHFENAVEPVRHDLAGGPGSGVPRSRAPRRLPLHGLPERMTPPQAKEHMGR